ncbi:MAG: phospholipase [Deltaproteobacteria bacterium]|nr:phospholipase [Deltaproteobacteria bacterium]
MKLLMGNELYTEVIQDKLLHARESVWIATANVKAMMVKMEKGSDRFVPIVEVFTKLAQNKVELRLLHAELPSRPFRAAFDKQQGLVQGGLQLKVCPRVHFKCVIVDGGFLYLGSANLTGAGLGAKSDNRRNFEIGTTSEDFTVIDNVCAMFNEIWTGKKCADCQRRNVCPDPIGKPEAYTKLRTRKQKRRRHSVVAIWKS